MNLVFWYDANAECADIFPRSGNEDGRKFCVNAMADFNDQEFLVGYPSNEECGWIDIFLKVDSLTRENVKAAILRYYKIHGAPVTSFQFENS